MKTKFQKAEETKQLGENFVSKVTRCLKMLKGNFLVLLFALRVFLMTKDSCTSLHPMIYYA